MIPKSIGVCGWGGGFCFQFDVLDSCCIAKIGQNGLTCKGLACFFPYFFDMRPFGNLLGVCLAAYGEMLTFAIVLFYHVRLT